MAKKPNLGFIGAGTVGTALAVSSSRAGYRVVAVADINLAAAKRLGALIPDCPVYEAAQDVVNASDHVFITTPDDTIAAATAALEWRPDQNVVHCSGAASLDILESARKGGASVGSFHPCQTFASIEQAIRNLPGTTFAIEAEPPLLETLQHMSGSLGGEWIVLKPGDKALYHAAAVFACNYLVTLTQTAIDLFHHFDVPASRAIKILTPLLQGTINNVQTVGLPHSLTGPIARGDVNTIRKHLDVLAEKAPHLLALYRELASHTIPIALAKGTLNRHSREQLEQLLKA